MNAPTIIIDTREQKPYRFDNSITKKLNAGDYSIKGLETVIAVERKTKADAYGTFGKGRARFERELKRFAEFDYKAIVIESSLTDFLKPPAFSKMLPGSAVNSVLAWTIKYRIHVFWACDREHGNAVTVRILEKYWKYYQLNRKQKTTKGE